MRNKVKLIATAAVAAGAVSLGAAALAGGSAWPSPEADSFFDELSGICEDGASAIFEWNASATGPIENFLENCLSGIAD
jgi:hypothetical protein